MTGDRPHGNAPANGWAETALEPLRAQFPGVPVWFGRHTCRFWALIHDGRSFRLVEALTPGELATAITRPRGWPWPPPR